MLLGFTVGGSVVGMLLTMSVFRDIIESIFIDGLTEKEYLDCLRRTERKNIPRAKWCACTKSVRANSARAS